jgi:ADP-heptose:LPS heptosyltransferase
MTTIGNDIKKIGIFRALQLGDLLCLVPAARAIRTAYPQAEITLISLPWAAGFVQRFNNYFDRFIHFPGYKGLPEQEFDVVSYQNFMAQMQHEKFDLMLQMQGKGTIVNEIMKGWHAKILAGFYPGGAALPSSWFVPYPEGLHEINRHLHLVAHLGIPDNGTALEFPLTTADTMALANLGLPFKPYEYVCIHPGSRGSYRQWPPELFAQAANLCHRAGFHVVLTGTTDEREIIDGVAAYLTCPWFNACGKTDLGSAAHLIAEAALLVSNCTGVAHVSAAVGTPSVIISMDGEPERWGPLNKQLHTTINWLIEQDPEIVFKAIDRMLERCFKKRSRIHARAAVRIH